MQSTKNLYAGYIKESTMDVAPLQFSDTSKAMAMLFSPAVANRLYERLTQEQQTKSVSLAAFLHNLRTAPDAYSDVLTKEQTARLLAVSFLARRLEQEHQTSTTRARISSAEDAIDYVVDTFTDLYDERNEYFYVVLVDIRNKVVGSIEISKGSVSAGVVDPADVLREACIHHASRVVLVHNHPSGECDPSREDIDTTNRIVQALKYVTVRVIDHIIVGRCRQDYFSFARAGMV